MPQPVIAMAPAAGGWNVQRIDGRTPIGLGKDRVGITVATGTRMVFTIGMDAAPELGVLLAMAYCALNLRGMIRMGIVLDVGVAIAALQTAVNARRKLGTVHCDAVPGGILHGLIAVACEAIRLCVRRE